MKGEMVIIVGGGPSGIAASACLNQLSIPNMLLEREDCLASLWRKKSYDRLHLHIAKQFCELPHMSFPKEYPTYVPRNQYLQYIDNYVAHFNIQTVFNRSVESAEYNEVEGKWHVRAKDITSDEYEDYMAKFLIVASGETSDPYIPEVEGLDSFRGDVLHSTQYKNGKIYTNKHVLVVGSGNSGMEIALDLSNFGAKTSIVVRSPMHPLNREIIYGGMLLFKYLPFNLVDGLLVLLSKLVYGDMSKYGIHRPKEGPFLLKDKHGTFPLIDVGTMSKIKSGVIQVLPSIKNIKGDNSVEFSNGKLYQFDTIIFATGFKRSSNRWLKEKHSPFDENGILKQNISNHWKGKNGVYYVGLGKKGLPGARMDALVVAEDIKKMK